MQHVERTRSEIADWLARAVTPAVAWTGGADSQALLHLVRSLRADVPLWWIRHDYADRASFAWQSKILVEMDVEILDWWPQAWSWVSDGQDVDLLALFRSGNHVLPVVLAVEPDTVGECVFDVTARTDARVQAFPFDVLFNGQRNGDEDGWGNTVRGLPASTKLGALTVAHPLREWTNSQIAEYVQFHQIPLAPSSQQGQTVRACVRCLTANGAPVECPKTGRQLQTRPFDYAAQQSVWRRFMEQTECQKC